MPSSFSLRMLSFNSLSIPISSRLLDSARKPRRDIRSFRAHSIWNRQTGSCPALEKHISVHSTEWVIMTSTKNMKKRSLIKSDWFLQILAILKSELSMIAIDILLTHFDNQPIFDWNGVTLNAIVAVFSVISKAMLVYALSECLGQAKWIWFSSQSRSVSDIELIDSGSRGRLGCFQLLTKPIVRSFISMGVIMIILSVTLDPFVQLTVGQNNDLRFENKSAVQITYAKRYSKESFVHWDTIGMIAEADVTLHLAVLEGLSQSDSFITQQTQHSCSSGNCTQDTFTSVAVTMLRTRLKKEISPSYIQKIFSQLKGVVYYLPNRHTGDFTMHMIAFASRNRFMNVSFTSVQTLFWSMTMMNFTKHENQAKNDSISAIECDLWWCVNNYKSTINNGILTETVQPASSSRMDLNSWQPNHVSIYVDYMTEELAIFDWGI